MGMADSAGYRVLVRGIKQNENNIQENINDQFLKYDPRKNNRKKTNQLLRGKRKVLVKKKKSKNSEVIPFQPALVLSTQYPGRREQRRLVGEMDLILVNSTNKDSTEERESPYVDDYLPSSVLLKRVLVKNRNTSNTRKQQTRRKHVKRRRLKRKEIKEGIEPLIYF